MIAPSSARPPRGLVTLAPRARGMRPSQIVIFVPSNFVSESDTSSL